MISMSVHDQPVSSAAGAGAATVAVDDDESDEQRAYLRDVLGLSDGENEDQLEERLKDEALQLGVDFDALPTTDTPSTTETRSTQSTQTFLSDPPRRSESLHSQSTGFTSIHSEFSRDRRRDSDATRSRFRGSLISRDYYDGFFRRSLQAGRFSISSSSPPTTPSRTSYYSVPLEPPSPALSAKKPSSSRRIKALNVLKLVRPDVIPVRTDYCPHCRQGDALSERRAIHQLPCGHRLCTEALRNLIQNATSGDIRDRPMCCNVQIPRRLVEQVLTESERQVWADRWEQWGDAEGIEMPLLTPLRVSIASQAPVMRSPLGRSQSDESRVDSVATPARDDLDWLRDRVDYQHALSKQAAVRERFDTWADSRRTSQQAHFARLRELMVETHAVAISTLLEEHVNAVTEAEDKQVNAEADLREIHAREKRDNATALKHIEAYCAGTYSNGEAHHRPVTEQSLTELEKARRTNETMDARHDNAINVLRGEQGRRMKSRIQRQDQEMQELRRTQAGEKASLDRSAAEDLRVWNERVAARLQRLRTRWILQMAILGKKIEIETSRTIAGGLPTAEWLVRDDAHVFSGGP